MIACLFEIVTAANMAGIEQAKAGMLGMNTATLGLAAALGILVVVGQAGIENYQKQEEATNLLKQATDAYNSTAGITTKVVKESAEAIAKAQDVAGKAHDSLTIATNATKIAQLAYTDAVHKHGVKSQAAYIANLHLQDSQIRLAQAQEAAKDSTEALAKATATTTTTTYHQEIVLADLKKAYADFKAANSKFITDQYDTEEALASVVRSGEDQTDALRILGAALDLSVIKHETVSEAATSLVKVLAGNAKALKELGITTDEYNAIMHDKTLTTEEKHLAVLTLIETKTKDGRKATDDLKKSHNDLTIAWQDFTSKTGPGVLDMWQKLNEAGSTALGILSVQLDLLNKLHKIVFSGSNSPGNTPAPGGYGLSYKGRASGGPVASGEAYTVGERGPETLVMGNQGGSIIPSGGNHTEIHIHIDGIYAGDGPSLDILANKIALRLGYATGR